jgi:hypothetical protein
LRASLSRPSAEWSDLNSFRDGVFHAEIILIPRKKDM